MNFTRSCKTRSRVPPLNLFLAGSVLLQGCEASEPTIDAVLVDGRFDEWAGAATLLEDGIDAPEAPIDLGAIRGLDDAEWFYLALDLGREASVQSLPGMLQLLIDVDVGGSDAGVGASNTEVASSGAEVGSTLTGGTLHGMVGVDLVIELSQTGDPLVAGRGSGFALRAVDEDGTTEAAVRYALGVTVAPSWSASRVELRVSRLGAAGLPPFGSELRLKAVYVEDYQVEDETPVGSYVFSTEIASSTPDSL